MQDYADAKADVVADVMSRARPRFGAPVRAVWVVVGRTSGSSRLAASLASALGLPLLDADRVAAVTGVDHERAAEAVAAMAADTGGAVLHGDLDPQSLTGLPGQVVQPPPLPGEPDAGRVAETIRQVVASAG